MPNIDCGKPGHSKGVAMRCEQCRERCISSGGIDPLIAGHKNGRFLESICYACPSYDRETFDRMRYPQNSFPQYVSPTNAQIDQVKAELAHVHTGIHELQAKKAKPKSEPKFGHKGIS